MRIAFMRAPHAAESAVSVPMLLVERGNEMSRINHVSGARAASSVVALFGLVAACSGGSWEDQRLIIDVIGRQSPDSPHVMPEHAVDEPGGQLAPGPRVCDTPLLLESYADGGAFWLGEGGSKHYEIDGKGYWAMVDRNNAQRMSYTRSAEVAVAPDGTIVDERGHSILGFGQLEDHLVQCPSELRAPVACNAVATRRIDMVVNFDPQSQVQYAWFDPLAPYEASDFSAALTVYDSLGTARTLEIYFGKVEEGAFVYYILVDGRELRGGTEGVSLLLGEGLLVFDTNGALLDAQTAELAIDFALGTPGQIIELDFGADIANDGTQGLGGSTSFSGPSYVASSRQDGFPWGWAVDALIASNGAVTVECSSGRNIGIGSVILARFPDEAALAASDADDTFRESSESGTPSFAHPGYPGRGWIQ